MSNNLIISAYFENGEGKKILSLSKCFLSHIVDKFKKEKINLTEKGKKFYFYYENYDFEIVVKENSFINLDIYNLSYRDVVCHIEFYFNTKNFNDYRSYFTIFSDELHDDKLTIDINQIPDFESIIYLLQQINRAIHNPIFISDDAIKEALEDGKPSLTPLDKVIDISRHYEGKVSHDIYELIVDIETIINRTLPKVNRVSNTEYHHVVNRLTKKELPQLFNLYIDLKEEEQVKQQDNLISQLKNIKNNLEKRQEHLDSTFYFKQIELIKERYNELESKESTLE